MGKEEKMIEAQKLESAKKVEYIKEIVDEMLEQGIAVTPYTVWKRSGLSKGFIYTNVEVKAYIEQNRSEKKYNYRAYTPQDVLQERVEQLEKENAYLKRMIRQMELESYEALLVQNQVLKNKLSKYEALIAKGIITEEQ